MKKRYLPAEFVKNIHQFRTMKTESRSECKNGTSITHPVTAGTKKHQKCIDKHLHERHGTSMDIETGLQTATERLTTKRHHEAEKLFRTAYLVVKENLPFKKYTSICKLKPLNGLELGENYLTDMACSRFVKSITGDLRNEMAHSINDCRFVSILSNGSTDNGIVEVEIIYARYI